jgi:hypothetical protein
VRKLYIDLNTLPPAQRRDLANALLRAAWSATLGETRVLLLDLLVEVDDAIGRNRVSGEATSCSMTGALSSRR